MREIYMQKTVRDAWNSYAKNSEKFVKFICNKQCEMREICMQKTVQNAWNLYTKNRAKFVKFIRKKQCGMRQFSANFAAFLAYKFGTFFSVFCRKIGRKLYGNFVYFSSFFVMIFSETVCRYGKSGIPVKSRSKCGNPDRDCTQNTRFCSAMSTKSEIAKVIPEKPLNPRWNRNSPV